MPKGAYGVTGYSETMGRDGLFSTSIHTFFMGKGVMGKTRARATIEEKKFRRVGRGEKNNRKPACPG